MATADNVPKPSKIAVRIRGIDYEVSGRVAGWIEYLVEQEKFFNDERNVGTYVFNLKDKSVQTKADVSVQI